MIDYSAVTPETTIRALKSVADERLAVINVLTRQNIALQDRVDALEVVVAQQHKRLMEEGKILVIGK